MSGKLAVVGLGPGDARYLTREALAALDEADALYGYGPYLDRVAPRSGQVRHPTGNREEGARARAALAHAARGAQGRYRLGRRSRRVRHGGIGLRGDGSGSA